jgi:glycosyltransferase involved in cell wall biosynthesis
MKSDKPRLLFLVTEDWVFWMHRLDLARAARDAGFEVFVATRVQEHGKRIEDEGLTLLPIRLSRGSTNPFGEWAAVRELIRLYRHIRPDIVHHVALKPVLYGSWAARIAGVPAVVNTFNGLGYVFIAAGWRASLRRSLIGAALRFVLARPRLKIIFQNQDDYDLMVQAGIVNPVQAQIIRGSGVDTAKFVPSPEPEGIPLVVLASRLLIDKGVYEFVEASRLLKKGSVPCRCVLAGMVDRENPAHITEGQLLAWHKEGVVEWWGHRENMPELLASAHVVVLPSYREGFPRVLLEATACARPIVATDVPGCREIVRDQENGFLVPPRNAQALFSAISLLVQDPVLRTRMGRCGREMVVRNFSSQRIVGETISVYRTLLDQARPIVMTGNT